MPENPAESAKSSGTSQWPDPRHLMQLATGYWGSSVLHAANRVRLFTLLSREPLTASQVAEKLGSTPRAAQILLDACCGLDLLARDTDRYRPSREASAYLVPESPAYLGTAIDWAADQFDAWGKLGQSLCSGEPVVDPSQHLGSDPARTRTFVLGMRERAKGLAPAVAAHFDLDGCGSILDVGGGPGVYSMLLAKKYAGLHATVLDLPGIVAVAEELIEEEGMSDCVETLPGDATTGEYGVGRYDAVLFSGVLHQMNPATIARMLSGAHRALAHGGRVILSDIMLDADKTQPVFATLFSVQMLLTSREGAVFSVAECEDWLKEAGFADRKTVRLPDPLPYTVVSATRR